MKGLPVIFVLSVVLGGAVVGFARPSEKVVDMSTPCSIENAQVPGDVEPCAKCNNAPIPQNWDEFFIEPVKTCIEWDGIPPAHCLGTTRYHYYQLDGNGQPTNFVWRDDCGNTVYIFDACNDPLILP